MLLVLNDHVELKRLERMVSGVYPGAEIVSFDNAEDALSYSEEHKVHICYTEVVMKRMSGIALAKHLRRKKDEIIINFISDTTEYALDGWKLFVNDYILKPITIDAVKHTRERGQWAS